MIDPPGACFSPDLNIYTSSVLSNAHFLKSPFPDVRIARKCTVDILDTAGPRLTSLRLILLHSKVREGLEDSQQPIPELLACETSLKVVFVNFDPSLGIHFKRVSESNHSFLH